MLDTVPTPRAELRLAIAKRDAAGQAENDAAKAVVRAKQLVKDAEQNVALLADGDHKIAKFRAAEVKAWTNGGEKPTGELPWHLESLRTFGIEAAARLVEARATYDLLNKELVAASGHLQHQEVVVYRAAGAVLSAEAPALIEDLLQARRRVWALEDKLKSLSAVRFSEADGRSVLIKMPPETFSALNETAPPMLAMSVPKPYAIALDRWNTFLQALTQDSEASLDSI